MAQERITYTTLSSDNENLHIQFDAAIEKISADFGKSYPLVIGNDVRVDRPTLESRSPMDTDIVLGQFPKGTREDVQDAIALARETYATWRDVSYEERCTLIEKAADLMDERIYELSAAIVMEMGKSRIEAMGEVAESADLLRWNAAQVRKFKGFNRPLGSFDPAKDENFSVLRPFGVWAVIAPFNFPMALATNPASAALVMGNTVIWKFSSDTPLTGVMCQQVFVDAGLPVGAITLVSGGGGSVGAELIDNPGVDGITFTGSYDVGYDMVYKKFAKEYPKPVVVEMGGKNPAIVMPSADLDVAAMGTVRAAFGMNGQKCSACSRVYVHESVKDEFVKKLVETTDSLVKVLDPRDRNCFIGPIVNQSAYDDFKRFTGKLKDDNVNILYGGNVIEDGDFGKGYYVEPTIFTDVAEDYDLVKNELFLPILYVGTFKTVEEALALANDTEYGLTAGFFSNVEEEIDYFFNNIEAGVVYVNRAAGATTGAWPGIQAFGGWKGSGSTGKAIGSYYSVQLYGREQSRTRIIG